MPFIRLETNVTICEDTRFALMRDLTKIVSTVLEKPKEYVMVSFAEVSLMMDAEHDPPAAFIELRSIGALSSQSISDLSAQLTASLEDRIAVRRSRVFLNFTDMSATHWGWQGEPFA